MAAAVKQTDGAVGYVEQAYALQNNFTTADVKNKSGKYIAPSLASTSAAGDGIKVPADLRFTRSTRPNPTAYPIASQTFLLVYKDMCKAGKSKANAQRVQDFLNYAPRRRARTWPSSCQYAPLPPSITPGQGAGRRADVQRQLDALVASCMESATISARGGRPVFGRPPLARLPDRLLKWGLTVLAGAILVLIGFFFIRLYVEAHRPSHKFGFFGFTFDNNWDVAKNIYGALPLLVGTADHVGGRAADRRARSPSPPRST